MKSLKMIGVFVLAAALVSLTGCGVSKDKYNAVLNEKIVLEEKANVLARSKDALKAEYDILLKEKMDLAAKVEVLTNEKNALKGEYDKILDEKVALKASYNKVQSDPKNRGI